MKGLTAIAVIALLCTVFSACTTHSKNVDSSVELTICNIVASGDQIVGSRVRSTGTYETDMFNYSFIIDEACGSEGNGIDVARARGVADYERLRRAWVRACEQKGSEQLCIVSAEVDFIGTVRMSTQGDYLVVDLESIEIR